MLNQRAKNKISIRITEKNYELYYRHLAIEHCQGSVMLYYQVSVSCFPTCPGFKWGVNFTQFYGQQQTAPTYIFNYHLGKKKSFSDLNSSRIPWRIRNGIKKRATLIGILHEFLEELGIRSKKSFSDQNSSRIPWRIRNQIQKRASLIGILHEFLEELGIRSGFALFI